VIGTFTPHKKLADNDGKRRRKPLDPIEGFFPAVSNNSNGRSPIMPSYSLRQRSP
jgi:hypothetical protein